MTQYEVSNLIIRNVNNLKPQAKLLLLSIVSFGGENNNWKCWPSQKTLAEMMNLSVRRVLENVQVLRDEGYISTVQQFDNSLIYSIHVDTLMSKMTVGSKEENEDEDTLMSKMTVPHVKNDSRVMSEMTQAHVENDTLTNQYQTIEQTIIKPINTIDTDLQEDEVSNDEIENEIMTSPLEIPSTVSDLPTVSNYSVQENEPIEDDPSSQCIPSSTVEYFSVPEFDNAIDAYQFVVSMGDSIDQNSFNRMFGRDAEYINDELAIKIKKVFL